ncbi:MAG: phosphoribosyl-AMP cyclohydrolase [Spirochaetales bacterium]|nr:phosphoribosyl-AMP cyclohydrolase [Spirochaetales bacterium]
MADKEIEESPSFLPQFEKRGGLLPVVVQDFDTKEILMVAYANHQAVERTLETGTAVFWSTSRNALWTKGETSGDTLDLVEVRVDCDQDALVYLVRPQGDGVCHTKGPDGKARRTCFYRRVNSPTLDPGLEFLPGLGFSIEK